MRWHKTTLKSIYGLFGQTASPTNASTQTHVQQIRDAMRDAMAQAGVESRHPHLLWRIQYADDAHALWHIRSDLMLLLAAELGEARAWQVMDALSARFKGLLPERSLSTGRSRRRPG